MTTKISETPVAEHGCIDCELPSFQDDLLFYGIVVSPFMLTIIISYLFVRRADAPMGILRLMAISVPGTVPAAIGLALAFEDELASAVTTTIVAVFIWTATIGPAVVFFTQWTYLELKRIRQRSDQ
ncbi:hypothetical protein [Erythrobacter sp. THAF29]|uniref:hypothetical protein n=1 Tax=Erythrobacter sp. THAF29 TaxID=2587851 RepID=UPI0012687919|nr:hypothetical protein [Erythrobacter sp. THAF29]QFT78146.1 hypothetical protein FIU90_11405 [Erythrobacter sp. THAF29]